MGYHAYQTNFTAGELTPGLFARQDFKKYANGAERMWNAVARVTGGAARRAGTMFVAKAKSMSAFQASMVQKNAFQTGHNDSVLLKDFVFNTNDAMVLEFGPSYIRFYKNRAQVQGVKAGGELVTNGAFLTDLSGWALQQDNGGTVTWEAAQRAVLTPGPVGAAGIAQQISGLVNGTKYVLAFDIDNANLNFDLGSTLGAGDVYPKTALTPGSYRLVFTASGTSVFINFVDVAPSTVSKVTNVSMGEATPLEVATPYKAEDIKSLRFAQSADVLYITHKKYPVKKLTRLSDALWTLQTVVFNPPATEEIPITPDAILTPGATTGIGVTFTTNATAFLNADLGRQIKSKGGVAIITAFVSGTQVTVDIIQPFLSTTPVGKGNWSMDGSPNSQITMSALGPVNAIVTATLTTAGFRSSDFGAFIHVNGGIFEITSISSSTVASAKVLKEIEPPKTAVGVAGAWTLERESWTAANGFPEVCTFYEQRLQMTKGQTGWASKIGDFENFGAGVADDDSYKFTISSGQVEVIRWLKGLDFLIAGTIGSEYKLDGVNGAITPGNPPKISPQSSWGSDPEPDALRAGAALIYIQRGRQQIREMAKAFEAGVDGFASADLAILASHIFQSGIRQIARCSSPTSNLFAVLDNGRMAIAAYERPEDVVAWGQCITQGKIKSVCVIPAKCGTGDEVWIACERFGELFIEVFDGQLSTDCALVYEGTTITAEAVAGLSHLETRTVDVVRTSQSAFQASAFQMNAFQSVRVKDTIQSVSGGVVTLASPAVRAEVGLHFDTEVKTLRIEVPTPLGTAQFRAKRTNTIYVRFQCTRGPGVFVDDEQVPEDNFLEVRDWSKQANLGWNRNGQVTIKQTRPFPMTVLGIAYAYSIDDGDTPSNDEEG